MDNTGKPAPGGEVLYLCATLRLAQTLRRRPLSGVGAWRTPQALTLAQWFAQLADEALLCGLGDLPQALDPYAECLLWEQVIAEALGQTAGAAALLFDLQGMAKSAIGARQLTRQWPALQAALASTTLADEARLFAGWQEAFTRRCEAHAWIDVAGWQRRLLDLLAAGAFALPAQLYCIGFDRLTPLESELLAILAARGVVVEQVAFWPEITVDREKRAKSRQLHAAADVRDECAAAVAWVTEKLATPEGRAPDFSIGIVVPHLAEVREQLEGLLDDALHPQTLRPDLAELPRSYNFSLGRPLAAQPLVASALDLLALAGLRGKVEQARFRGLLLGNGWSGDVAEADARARLEARVRRDLAYFTHWPAVLRLAGQEDDAEVMPRSLAALRALAGCADRWPRRQSPAAWANDFSAVLVAAGWPGERPLSSHEFQARRAFGELLVDFSRLDPLLGSIDRGTALRRLGELCRQRVFQPETRGQPTIQVLGVLESAGLRFDALWIMGMNDDQWPPAPRPNPLLPAEVQRAVAAAHASAEVELDFACRVQARLLQAAPEIVLSWAQADGNRIRRASPLLDMRWPRLPSLRPCPSPLRAEARAAGNACEEIVDTQAPPLAAGERVAGGSWLLRAQAICPAWAFYQFRLHAEALDEAVEGLDPAARGTLVHGALEAFWKATGDSTRLRAQSPEGRATAVASACETALAGYEHERRSPLPPRFRVLEAARLQRLLLRWLALEAERGGEFRVLACEQPASVEIEGIQVKMVVDRIDALADGQLILDYKTGAAIDVRNWASPRITEPQLPIYAALVPAASGTVAVAFAKVLPDKPAFAGVAASGELLPGVPGLGDGKQRIFAGEDFPDWDSVLDHWRQRLQAVAREVRAGEAGVVFSDEKLLQYCELKPLLRLPERRRWLARP
ncbi:MAG: PD-(D/E)XK nuclease family protein [Azonexus sp.]|nr:PD-(D/E)XK nuclease family protein [Azonexus sp.]MCK6411534.1 PD-(D/E)XK nuclease family protein [Azonexus sp.]